MSRGSAIGASSPSARSWRRAPKSGRSSSAAMTCRASCWRRPCGPIANRYAAAAGKSVVVFTNNDSGYRTARDLKAHGVHVEVIIDSRKEANADAGGVPVFGAARSSMSRAASG